MGKKNDVKRDQKVNIGDVGITLIIGMFLLAFSVMLYVVVPGRQSDPKEVHPAESLNENEEVEMNAIDVKPEETLHMEESLTLRAEETVQQAQSQKVIDESKEPVEGSTDNNSNRDLETPILDESEISIETNETTPDQNSGNIELDSNNNWTPLTVNSALNESIQEKRNDLEKRMESLRSQIQDKTDNTPIKITQLHPQLTQNADSASDPTAVDSYKAISEEIEDSTIKLTEDIATVTERWYSHLNGGIYTGSVKDDLPDGSGTLVWDGGTYEGTFVDGYPKGSGTFHFASDSMQSISGTWSYGKLDMKCFTGPYKGGIYGKYTGMLFQGVPCGYGVVVYENSKYSGSFVEGHPAGNGTYVFANSTKAKGEYGWTTNSKLKLQTPKQNVNLYYTGMLKDGKPHGFGELSFEKGGTFYGEFINGDVNGEGVYAYSADINMIHASKETGYPYGSEELKRLYGSEAFAMSSGSNWKLVTHHSHQEYPGYVYYGLMLDDDWQGYGLGITPSNNYYIGEVVDCSRNGYGRLYMDGRLYQEGYFFDGYLVP